MSTTPRAYAYGHVYNSQFIAELQKEFLNNKMDAEKETQTEETPKEGEETPKEGEVTEKKEEDVDLEPKKKESNKKGTCCLII